MQPPLRSALSALLVVSLAVTAPGCLAGLSPYQRQQCQQLRRMVAVRAVGGVLASVVVLGVLVIASAAGGSSPNFGNIGRPGRRRDHREARREACREPQPGDPGFVVELQPITPVVGEDSPGDVPILPEPSGPPSVSELDEAIVQQYADLVTCGLQPQRLLYLDARIKGYDGSVAGVVLGGEGSYGVSVSCVTTALSDMRFRPFDGVVDVRWAIQLDAPAP